MLRLRLLLLLAGSFLLASAAWADDIGYVDCSSHPDASPVYAKARQSQEIVASVPCGERFTVLLYGFIFSRVQTADNKVGFVLSSLISVDHSATSVSRSTTARPAVAATNSAPATAAPQSQPRFSEPVTTQSRPAPVQAVAQPEPATVQSVSAQPAPAQPAPVQSAPAQSATVSSASASSTPTTEITLTTKPAPAAESTAPSSATPASQPTPSPAAESQLAPVQPAPVPVSATTPAPPPDPVSHAPEHTIVAAPPSSAAAAQPQPAAAEPEPEPVRNARTSWERPVPGARRNFLVELYGGYAYSGFNSGSGSMTNMMGGLGSFGWNMTPWLQIVGDSSYNFVTTGGTKTVLYGNHFGPRFFYHMHNRWNVTPFVEALAGGSRLDTTVSGTGGYKTSVNCVSYKAGGGIDIRASRHFEIRLFNFDYYRTSFGTNTSQNNYSASAGVVLRLFATGASE